MLTLTKNSYSDNVHVFGLIALLGGYDYSGTSEIDNSLKVASLTEKELTKLCMSISEPSLAKVWEDEDDAYWESYLKD